MHKVRFIKTCNGIGKKDGAICKAMLLSYSTYQTEILLAAAIAVGIILFWRMSGKKLLEGLAINQSKAPVQKIARSMQLRSPSANKSIEVVDMKPIAESEKELSRKSITPLIQPKTDVAVVGGQNQQKLSELPTFTSTLLANDMSTANLAPLSTEPYPREFLELYFPTNPRKKEDEQYIGAYMDTGVIRGESIRDKKWKNRLGFSMFKEPAAYTTFGEDYVVQQSPQ